MRFLIDADLPRATEDLLRSHGHEAVDVRDIGLGEANDSKIASYACQHGLCLGTGDFDFSDIRIYPPHEYHGLVVLSIPRNGSSRYILGLLESFLMQRSILETVDARLAIVESGRVRFRG